MRFFGAASGKPGQNRRAAGEQTARPARLPYAVTEAAHGPHEAGFFRPGQLFGQGEKQLRTAAALPYIGKKIQQNGIHESLLGKVFMGMSLGGGHVPAPRQGKT